MIDLLIAFFGGILVAAIGLIPLCRRLHDQRVPEQLRPREWPATFDQPAYLRDTISRTAIQNQPLWDKLAQFHQESGE